MRKLKNFLFLVFLVLGMIASLAILFYSPFLNYKEKKEMEKRREKQIDKLPVIKKDTSKIYFPKHQKVVDENPNPPLL